MSRRTAESNKAILAAWNKEQELVQEGKGTREWTPGQQRDILEKGKAYDEDGVAFQGQHMKSAEMYPECQGDPGNIQFLTRAEHLEAHNGNWKNPTNWYFNPVTKEKLDFGDNPFIPCEIIDLPEPVMRPSVTSEAIEEKKPDSIKEVDTKKESRIKLEPDTVKVNATNTVKPDTMPAGGFGNKMVNFCNRHPVLTEIVKAGVGAVLAGLVAKIKEVVNGGHSGSGNSGSFSYSNDDVLVDNPCTDISIERSSPEEHMVKGHGQRYHYKDGSVRWKEKDPYSRGGNKDE